MAGTTKAQIKAYNAKNKAPSLKSQGAGYSTTNRKGITTFYKSSKDAPDYTDGSKGKAISQFDSMGNKLTSESIKPLAPITLPTPAPVDGMSNVTDTINASLASLGGGTYDTKTKQIQPAPQQNQFQDILSQYLGANQQAFDEMPSAESRVKAQQKVLRPKENLVNQLQGQINTITANREASKLSLEGQGRGQTEGFIGGEQARIDREAAIRALPIQAQLAAAQDDLESARSYASQLFQAQSQDAQARYNYQRDAHSTIFNYLNEEQKRTLASKEREEDRAFAVEQSNRNNLKQLSMQALEWGQGALAGEIMKLDPSSPTFDTDYADVTSRLRKPVTVTSTKRDTAFDKDGNLVDMQTGEILSRAGGGGVAEKQQEQMNETLTLARELLSDKTPGKSGAVGAAFQKFVPFGLTLGLQGDRASFENKVNTLKANLTLENLSLLKGPMSDKDLAFLQAIGSSLTTNMSEKSFNKEMTRIVNKIEERIANPVASGSLIITAPDGTEVEIID